MSLLDRHIAFLEALRGAGLPPGIVLLPDGETTTF